MKKYEIWISNQLSRGKKCNSCILNKNKFASKLNYARCLFHLDKEINVVPSPRPAVWGVSILNKFLNLTSEKIPFLLNDGKFLISLIKLILKNKQRKFWSKETDRIRTLSTNKFSTQPPKPSQLTDRNSFFTNHKTIINFWGLVYNRQRVVYSWFWTAKILSSQ